jgi:hypothetical protein
MTTKIDSLCDALFDIFTLADEERQAALFAALQAYRSDPSLLRRLKQHPFAANVFAAIEEAESFVREIEGAA